MAIDIFDFIHSVADTYPQSSVNVRFGGGYQYSTYPLGPDQIIFICTFRAMQWFLDDDGNVDATINETYNMRALQIFYENNGTHKTFIYLHPVRGPGVLQIRVTPADAEDATRGQRRDRKFRTQANTSTIT